MECMAAKSSCQIEPINNQPNETRPPKFGIKSAEFNGMYGSQQVPPVLGFFNQPNESPIKLPNQANRQSTQ
jgi:hypothetical protein